MPISWTFYFLSPLYFDFAISCAPIYLITWRVVRRFGWRGLATFLILVAAVGPLRDYRVAAMFPEWIVFAPGVTPILAVAASYVGIVALGHAVMRFVADPSRESALARRPWHAG